MKKFSAFLERKDRLNKDHLRLLGKILERAGFAVKDNLKHHQDPYLYIEKPIKANPIIEDLDFGGIRIYSMGKDIISFRPQNKNESEPFGTAYLLDVKGMFKDLISEGQSEKTAKDLIKYLVEEILNFFLHSARLQNDEDGDVDGDSLGKIIGARDSNQDYANQVTSNSKEGN
jgi:hypothetical protein